MRIFRKNIFMCLAILCAFIFLSQNVFAAKAGFEEGGDPIPPYGATGDPGGTKLTGVMYIYYLNYHEVEETPQTPKTFVADGARFALRLQREKSSNPEVYYGEYYDPENPLDFLYPASILATFYSILEEQVEWDYFENDDMCIKIKSMKNEGNLSIYPPGTIEDIIVLVDVELAAKPYVEGECDY